MTNLSGAVGNLTPQQINAAMQALGISSNEALALQQQLATGVISPSEAQSLCAHLAASNISPAMVQTVLGTIGLGSAQLQQIQGCLGGGGAAAVSGQPMQGPSMQGPSMQGPLMQGPSMQGPSGAGAPTQISGGVPPPSVSPGGGSLIEQSYGQLDLELPPPNPSPVNLGQFGYSVFASAVSTFAPIGNVPVGPDYVIGPGDQLVVYEWGRVNQTLGLVVDRDGSVEVSGIEPLQVGGLTFSQAKRLIEGRVAQISNLNVHVTMGQLRTIQVLVVGAVNQPGAYTISPLSRVSNALLAAGGISKIGTLRNVELRRGNQVIKRIDFYALLLRGDNGDDEYLQTNDIVFVSPIGPVIGVAGDVQRPAIYELARAQATVQEAIRLAGGKGPFSDTERVQVLRVDKQRRLIALDVGYDQLAGRRFHLQDGDLVKVFHILTLHQDVVELTGNVRRPGEYQWRRNLTVSDLVKEGSGVAEHTYFKYALVRRLMYPSLRYRYVPVDLGAALSGPRGNPADIVLQLQDELDIFNEDNLREAPTVGIAGEVQTPGTYQLSPGMRLSDLMYMAGGLKNDADRTKIQITRTEVVDGGKTRFQYSTVDYERVAVASGSALDNADPLLVKDDRVYVTVASGWHEPWTVNVSGQVMRPGVYPIGRGDRLSTVLKRCGGLTPDAFPKGIVFARPSIQQMEQERLKESVQQISQGIGQLALASQASSTGNGANNNGVALGALQSILLQAQNQQATGRMVVHLRSIDSLTASSDDVLLQDGDDIAIPRTPASVNVLGSVNQPSSIVAQPGWTVKDYLFRAGGPSPSADQNLIMVVKSDGAVITQESLDKFHTFPFYSVVSGGLMGLHLEAGDTIYIPADVQTFIKAKYWVDITSVIASAAQTLGVVGLLATR